MLWCLPCAIIGARVYYVLCEWDYYSAHPGEIIAVWNGGLAIYGSIIATVIVVLLWLYMSGQILVLGAEFSAALIDRETTAAPLGEEEEDK